MTTPRREFTNTTPHDRSGRTSLAAVADLALERFRLRVGRHVGVGSSAGTGTGGARVDHIQTKGFATRPRSAESLSAKPEEIGSLLSRHT